MIKTVPKIPLGPYPHPLLWGHAGIAPISNKIKMTNSTVPNMRRSFVEVVGRLSIVANFRTILVRTHNIPLYRSLKFRQYNNLLTICQLNFIKHKSH